MSVSTNDFKNGMTLELDGTLFQIIEFQHVKPGKGGAFVRTKLRNVKSGPCSRRTFNAGVKVGLAIVERKHTSTSTATATTSCSWTCRRYEQMHVPRELVGDARRLPGEGAEAQVAMHEGVPIAVDLPASVVLTITKTDPGVKGDTRTGAMKPATLETGAVVQRAAVRRGGRADQGRHALRRVHRAREGLSVTTRREARRIAIDILYQADLTDAAAARRRRRLARRGARGAGVLASS